MTDLYTASGADVNPEIHDDIVSKRRYRAPQKLRHGETRDGGFLVIERTRKKRLLRPSAWPVECASLAVAYAAAKRLQRRYPDKEFAIFEQVGSLPCAGDAE